jgi:hypothetical protein
LISVVNVRNLNREQIKAAAAAATEKNNSLLSISSLSSQNCVLCPG